MNCAKPVIILLVYRAPNTSISEFNNNLSSLLDNLRKGNKFTFIMGDLNIDISKQYLNEQPKQEFANLFLSNSFLVLIKNQLELPRNRHLCLILYLPTFHTNTAIVAYYVQMLVIPFFCIMTQTSIQEKIPSITKWNFKGKNVDIFKNCLLNHNWNSVLSC